MGVISSRKARMLGAVATVLAVVLSGAVAAAPAVAAEGDGSLSGKVTDSRGVPIEDAYVFYFADGAGGGSGTLTNDAGEWSVPNLAAGTYRLLIDPYYSDFMEEWYDNAFSLETATPVVVVAGESLVIPTIELADPGTIIGEVKAADNVLKRVTVSAHQTTAPYIEVARATTDIYGKYRLRVATGTYKLKFTPSDDHDVQWWNRGSSFETASVVTVARDAVTDLGTTTVGHNFTTVGNVTVAGIPAVGKTLTASTTAWVPAPSLVTYQWFRNGSPITIPSYSGARKVSAADAGQSLTVAVSSTLAGYLTTTATSSPVQIELALSSTPVPTITGTSLVGKRLTANPGVWTPSPVTLKYQWTRDGRAISKATGKTYVLTRYDRYRDIRVVVTGSKDGYSSVAKTSARRTIR